MRLFWSLLLCLLFVVPNANAEQVVVEKIVSDATAIETIVFESAPAHSQRVSTSLSNSNSKHVIIVDDVLSSNSGEQVAQLFQGSSIRPPQSSSRQFYTLPASSSDTDSLLQVVTLVKVDKSKRRMYLLKGEEVIQEFRIALGKQPKGHKRFEGDNRTPEGEYQLDYVMKESDFYRSVHINYPQPSDMQWAEQNDVDPGGNIKIHGIKNGEHRSPSFIQSFDWTDGCIALTNQDMDEFLQLVKMGTPIHIEW
ncbi:L,D-transpeptidase family protein [Vibrio crassostreae]|uniref:L,D-transpeptidase family protein n=1 Tax=Vibrio crassostreae TaxID=246167 RepID=UPI000F4ACF61|nr:L,D-transpeptidase family protein [Vibrio crassostreae]ROO53229.1 L,D-transpeptidase-like protein [Vibrio crassostreae]ROO54894.1 L,D-transpeptidase-like protein [Vibrio crassostreae]ROO69005.1 L,D-transpeptidase-like protein [Vibrio crassostreae]ROO70546.1 L,D-transpeptidase-like protein [Vibrio crassostreae]ROR63555.1 L,D-transpeptidase-like protein [Vibrio crassostreae]